MQIAIFMKINNMHKLEEAIKCIKDVKAANPNDAINAEIQVNDMESDLYRKQALKDSTVD